MKRCHIEIGPDFLVGLCLCVLLLPLKWVVAWVIAAAVHECFHLLAVKLLGGCVEQISVRIFGAQIRVELDGKLRRVISILAGSIGGLCLLILANIFPRVAICGLLQSAFNLLPIYPLDGAKVLLGVLESIFGEERGTNICRIISHTAMVLIILITLYCGIVLKLGYLPLLVALLLWFLRGKKPLQTPVAKGTIGIQETNEVSL